MAGRRNTLTFRITDDLHAKLKQEAIVSQRSISELIEWIIDRHFEVDRVREIVRDELHRAGVVKRVALD